MHKITFERLSTGVRGLDEILHGGLIPGRSYVVRGGPGSGKTTMGLHFVTSGLESESALFITIEERESDVRKNAAALGFDLDHVEFLDLSPGSEFFTQGQSYDIFSPSEVEREPTTQKIIQEIEWLRPKRVFLEIMTEFRYLSSDPFQFRKQVLSFLRFLTEKGVTVFLSSEGSTIAPDDDLQFMTDGVINLNYDASGRTVCVTKFRGSAFRSGIHSMRLTSHGMEVFPRLLPARFGRKFAHGLICSGVSELDELLHGGLERGTITIITGPTGVGKTSLGVQFMAEAASHGMRSVVYTFEEPREMLLRRAHGMEMELAPLVDRGTLSIVQVEPLRYTPDEFADLVRREVEEKGANLVMVDSVAGYHLSMHGEEVLDHDNKLVSHLHALFKYLRNMGVTGILVNELEHLSGDLRTTSGISYLTDNIILLRYLERNAEIHRAIGILKKRLGGYDRTLHELEITAEGIKIGRPLVDLRGLLPEMPEWGERREARIGSY